MEKLNLTPEEMRFILNEINAHDETRRNGITILKELIVQDEERGLPMLALQHREELTRLHETQLLITNINVQLLYALNP